MVNSCRTERRSARIVLLLEWKGLAGTFAGLKQEKSNNNSNNEALCLRCVLFRMYASHIDQPLIYTHQSITYNSA